MNPVKITPLAAKKVREIMAEKEISPEYCLRVGVESGGAGCMGVNHMLGFDKKKEGDMEYKVMDIPVLVEKKQLMFVIGLTLDYLNEEEWQGFTFVKDDDKVSS